MSELSRSESARLNGAKSRGPVTAEGKSRSSRNAIKHGLTSKLVVLPHEDREAYEELRAGFFQRFHPATEPQAQLVDLLAATAWRQQRIVSIETELFDKHMREAPGEFALATAFEHMCENSTMALLIRYEGQLSRIFDRGLKQLRALQAEQRNEPEAKPIQAMVEPVLISVEPQVSTSDPENALTNPIPPLELVSKPLQEPMRIVA